jgi:hypothetical protein
LRELASREIASREITSRELASRELALRELASRELTSRKLTLRELASSKSLCHCDMSCNIKTGSRQKRRENSNLFCYLFQVSSQDYEVMDIDCSFGEVSLENNRNINQKLSANLRKPEGFQGNPIFADDRSINPANDRICQIRPNSQNDSELSYKLLITDLEQCGVIVKNVSLIRAHTMLRVF